MGNWWADRIGAQQPQQPPAPSFPTRIHPANLPPGIGSDPQRAVDNYLRQQQQATAPVPPVPQYPQQQQQQEFVPIPSHEADKVSQVLPIWQWQGDTKGAAGHNSGACPNCGSPRYMAPVGNGTTKINEKTGQTVGMVPQCMDCGYPREQGALGYAATVTMANGGSATSARQGRGPSEIPGSTRYAGH